MAIAPERPFVCPAQLEQLEVNNLFLIGEVTDGRRSAVRNSPEEVDFNVHFI
jgi:hypothetical protein